MRVNARTARMSVISVYAYAATILVIISSALSNILDGSTSKIETFGAVEDIDDGRIWSFRVEVVAGALDCYFQEIRPGELVNVDFNVMEGREGSAGKMGFSVTNVDTDTLLFSQEWTNAADYFDRSQAESQNWTMYKFCLNNTLDSNSYKHVNFHISAFKEGWGKFEAEIERLNVQSNFFVEVIKKLQYNVVYATTIIYHSRARESRDLAARHANNANILFWSSLTCFWIIMAGSMQVYFIKQLFAEKGSGLTPKY